MAKCQQRSNKEMKKPKKDVRAKAEELTAGLASDEEKLHRIYDFVQHDIKNIAFDPNTLWLKLEWLWQRPMPPVIDILREWKLI